MAKKLLDFIMLLSLKKILIFYDKSDKKGKKLINALEFRSETLKELELVHLNFREIDLSF